MRHQDHQWMLRLVRQNCPAALFVKLHKVGKKRVTVRVRFSDRSESDQQVHDREAYFACLHPDVWEARLARSDADGEIYEVVFAIPAQLSFL